MPRAGYRQGEKRVDVWLSTAGHAHLRGIADGWGCSLSDAVSRLVREKVMRDGDGRVGADVGGRVEADGGGSGYHSRVAGNGAGGVVADHVVDALTPDWDALMTAGKQSRGGTLRDTVSQDPWADPVEEIA